MLIQRGFYWEGQGGGEANADIELQTTNQIWVGNAPAGDELPLYHFLLWLPEPPDFPRRALISGIWVGIGGNRPHMPGEMTEISIWVDPAAYEWKTADPPGSETGVYMGDTLLYQNAICPEGSPVFCDDRWFANPIQLDRDAGDMLMVKVSTGVPYSWVFFNLMYLEDGSVV